MPRYWRIESTIPTYPCSTTCMPGAGETSHGPSRRSSCSAGGRQTIRFKGCGRGARATDLADEIGDTAYVAHANCTLDCRECYRRADDAGPARLYEGSGARFGVGEPVCQRVV